MCLDAGVHIDDFTACERAWFDIGSEGDGYGRVRIHRNHGETRHAVTVNTVGIRPGSPSLLRPDRQSVVVTYWPGETRLSVP